MLLVVMEPALEILNRSLHGDEGARSFLDRTSSIYVLDATDLSKPKTYGCWNFIHQALNEVERFPPRFRVPPLRKPRQETVLRPGDHRGGRGHGGPGLGQAGGVRGVARTPAVAARDLSGHCGSRPFR